MATPNYTEEEIQFRKRARRRLVGAVVLVAVVVALVPMILPENKPQQDSQPIDIRIPSQDATGYAPKILPAPGTEQTAPSAKPAAAVPPAALNAAPAAPAGKSSVEPIPAVNVAKPSETKSEQAPQPVAAPAESKPAQQAPLIKAVAEPPKPAKPADSAKQTYFVQYGAFSEMKNAKQRQADLKSRGVNTFTEVVKTTAGDKIRVRSGPYAAREQADKVREKVKPIDSKLVVMGNG
ncbi:MAG: SPOR domain-containing protein [Hydrogenophilales bacterium]|nr:SPOR domain-containing protein [Hydrogenophilales bacterium]